MIRPAKQADARMLGQVYSAAWKTAYRGLMPDFFLEILTPENCAPKPDHIAPDRRLVAAEEDTVIGTVTFDDGEIRSIYLLPEHWGRGAGQELFRGAVTAMRERGCETVMLWVQRDNARARRFFEKMGMKMTENTRETEIAGEYLTEIQYRL